jgi:hypothetical protein
MLTVNAYGVTSATEPLAPMTTSRRDPKARTRVRQARHATVTGDVGRWPASRQHLRTVAD